MHAEAECTEVHEHLSTFLTPCWDKKALVPSERFLRQT